MLAAAAFALLATAVPLACGGDDGDKASGSTTTAKPGSSTTSSVASGDGKVVEVKAVDFAFDGIPSTVPSGTKFTLTNSSEAELHEMVIFRLKDGETRSMSELVKLPESESDQLVDGPPAAVILAMPKGGEVIPALGDGTVTQPGRYAVICSIPTGADPQAYLAAAQEAGDEAPQVDGGQPHMLNGMFAEFTVS